MDTFGQMPAAGLCRIHMDPEQPVPGLGHHTVHRASCPTRRSTPSSPARRPGDRSPLLLTELRQLGGALGRAGRERRRPRPPRRRLRDARRSAADDARAGPGDRRPRSTSSTRRWRPGSPTAATSTSPSAPATPTRSSRADDLRPPGRGQAPVGPRRHDRRQPRRLARRRRLTRPAARLHDAGLWMKRPTGVPNYSGTIYPLWHS